MKANYTGSGESRAQRRADELRRRDFDKTIDIVTALAMLTLVLKFGFGPKRLRRFFDGMNEITEAHGGYGEALLEAVVKHLRDCGIDWGGLTK